MYLLPESDMIIRKQLAELELAPGDEVVAVTAWREWLMVVTKRGAIFQVMRERNDD